jgi:hypothetical protein
MYITSFSQLQDWKSQILLGSAYRSLTNKTKVLANTPYGACKCTHIHTFGKELNIFSHIYLPTNNGFVYLSKHVWIAWNKIHANANSF